MNRDAPNGNGSRRIKAVVFDFDGTLAELHLNFDEMKNSLHLLAGEYAAVSWQPPFPPVLEFLKSLSETIGSSGNGAEKEFRARAHALIVEIELAAAKRGRLFPFTRDLLENLRHKGIATAIITRNCETAVRLVFPDIDHYCPFLLTRDNVPLVKPDPDHLLRALQGIGVEPETAIMVGDHPIDIMTGKLAGSFTAGVASGNVSESELTGSGADWTAGNCKELFNHLEVQGLV